MQPRAQPRSTPALERPAPQDRHRRLAGVRRRAFMVGGNVGTKMITAEESAVGESGQRRPDRQQGVPRDRRRGGPRLQPHPRRRCSGVPAHGRRRAATGSGRPRACSEVVDPYTTRAGGISADGHTAMVSFDIDGDSDSAAVGKIVDGPSRDEAAQKAHPEVRVEQFGGVSSEEAFNKIFERDLQKARHDLAAADAGHPAGRLRHAHRRRHPAAARGDARVVGDDGPRRPAQPARSRSRTRSTT